MARLFHERIEALGEEGLEADYGFDVVRLAALAVETKTDTQASLDEHIDTDTDLADLIDRLGARLGVRRVTRLVLQDRYEPEFAVISVPASSKMSLPKSLGSQAIGTDAERLVLPSRPLRLLPRPELIEAIASVPDGPPSRFRWRRILHEVAAVEGPERIAPEWWKGSETSTQGRFTRDYFRAENSNGQSFWIYREGLYREAVAPRWFMHGLFA
jgi:protein ImuB